MAHVALLMLPQIELRRRHSSESQRASQRDDMRTHVGSVGSSESIRTPDVGPNEIASIIRPLNVASMRVAGSLGATPCETVQFFGAPSVVHRYPE
jgi:hypothetical protein